MQRYSQQPFPPYRYTPGRNPHPVIDSDGHSYGHEDNKPAFEPASWRASPDYRFGIDLLNHGYYWEAHEVFEGIWHLLGRRGDDARFIQALILLAVACLHQRRGRAAAVIKVAAKGLERLEGITDDYFGCRTAVLREYLQLLHQGRSIKPVIYLMM